MAAVALDARADRLAAAGADLVIELRVCELSAANADELARTGGEQALHLVRILKSAGCGQRDRDARLLHLPDVVHAVMLALGERKARRVAVGHGLLAHRDEVGAALAESWVRFCQAAEIWGQRNECAVVLNAAHKAGHRLAGAKARGVFLPGAEELFHADADAVAHRVERLQRGVDFLPFVQQSAWVGEPADADVFQRQQRRHAAADVRERAEGRKAGDDGGDDGAGRLLQYVVQRFLLGGDAREAVSAVCVFSKHMKAYRSSDAA